MTLATDVVVIGAGPAGSAAAAHLAAGGADVLVLERDVEPATDSTAVALTPQAVAELAALGLTDADTTDWHRTTGVRFVGGGMRLALAWPDAAGSASHGLVAPRAVLADTLASYAVRSGAVVRRGVEVAGLTRDAAGRVTGVATTQQGDISAELVVDASGVGVSPSGTTSGGGVAVTADFASPRHGDDHVETWLELSDAAGTRLPGHGWIIGRGDGRVTVGVGALTASPAATTDACARVLDRWLTALPAEWELTATTQVAPAHGARLGTRYIASSAAEPGLLRVGDAAGLANPTSGEGLTAALTSGRLAAEAVRSGGHTAYATALNHAFGGSRRLLDTALAAFIDRPWATRLATTWALPHQGLMSFALSRSLAA